MKFTYSLDQLPEVAANIIKNCSSKTIRFNGDMGVGKTTLIKELVKQLGAKDIANSPTFSLVNEYLSDTNDKIYHFDFYRIESEDEAFDMGLEDYLYDNKWSFIEWGEKVENLLPLDIVNINIVLNGKEKRTLEIA